MGKSASQAEEVMDAMRCNAIRCGTIRYPSLPLPHFPKLLDEEEGTRGQSNNLVISGYAFVSLRKTAEGLVDSRACGGGTW
jgi:hypothetical protein